MKGSCSKCSFWIHLQALNEESWMSFNPYDHQKMKRALKKALQNSSSTKAPDNFPSN